MPHDQAPSSPPLSPPRAPPALRLRAVPPAPSGPPSASAAAAPRSALLLASTSASLPSSPTTAAAAAAAQRGDLLLARRLERGHSVASPAADPAPPRSTLPASEPAPPPPRRATRLEGLLDVILAEQAANAQRIETLQDGLDQLGRAAGPGPASPPRARGAAASGGEGAAGGGAPASAAASAAVSDSLVDALSAEVALLNTLSSVLRSNHEVAARRAAEMSVRLERARVRAQAAAAAAGRPPPPPPLTGGGGGGGGAALPAAAAPDALPPAPPAAAAAAEPAAAPASGGAPGAAASAPAPAPAPPSGLLLRSLLDYVATDGEFARVLALLHAAGGDGGGGAGLGAPPASDAALCSVPAAPLPAHAHAACLVCLQPLGGGGDLKRLPCSGAEGGASAPHAFHAPCIDAWLRLHNACPICRKGVQEPGRAGGGGGAATQQQQQQQQPS